MSGAAQFVHLRLHTEYSLLDGIVRVPELMAAVAAAAMPAVALTDQSNLFAMVKFYKEAQARRHQAPDRGRCLDARGRRACAAVAHACLCQDLVGYRHLTQLVTRSYPRGPAARRADARARLARAGPSAGPDRPVGRAGGRHRPGAGAGPRRRGGPLPRALAGAVRRPLLSRGAAHRPRRRTGYAEAVLELARARGVPAVATNDVRFLRRAEFEAHEARVCIHDGALLADPTRPRRYSEEQYLKCPAEMAELFADAPELLVNTVEIAKRCSLEIKLGASMLPAYPVPRRQHHRDYSCATSRVRGLGPGSRSAKSPARRRRATRGLRGASRSRTRRHLQDGVRRVFLDRGGFHPLGARQRRAGGPGPRLRRRLAGRLSCSASPIWIRSSTTCCSNGS